MRPLALKRSGRKLVGPCPSCGGTDRRPTNGAAPVTVYEYRDPCGIPNPENRRAHLIVLTRKGERTIMAADA